MTRSTGVGRGVGSGGIRPGGGRWPGSRNKRSVARIAQMAENRRTDPLDFLTRVMDDERFQARDRVSAATALLPYFHTRLVARKVLPSVATMGESDLLHLLEQISERLGPTSAADRSHALADQVDGIMSALEELSPHRQRALLNQLATATQARLQELAKPQPGDVLPHNSRHAVIEHEPSAAPQGPIWGDGNMPNGSATAPPARSAQREIKYERDATGKLVRVN
jgi:hypothetical protein